MSRMANLSPLGLYQWDNTVFDLMRVPQVLSKDILVNNILAETAELEVLYTNPTIFKNLVGVWSEKQIDIWNKLYETTQYEYNPIENYNRYETGSQDGAGMTTHSGTDTTSDTTAFGGADTRKESITHGGKDTVTRQNTENSNQGEQSITTSTEGGTQGEQTTGQLAEGGTQGEQTTGQLATGGQDIVTGSDDKGHWVAGFDSVGSGTSDGLVKQTRDEDDAQTTTQYGKTESSTGSKTTTFGKTESNTGSKTTTFGKTENETGNKNTVYESTGTGSDITAYGETEKTEETKTYGQNIIKAGNMTHGEQISTSNEGSHTLHAHGNIGVTTTQKLIREQRDIDQFNLYDYIIEEFKMRFCILVY